MVILGVVILRLSQPDRATSVAIYTLMQIWRVIMAVMTLNKQFKLLKEVVHHIGDLKEQENGIFNLFFLQRFYKVVSPAISVSILV